VLLAARVTGAIGVLQAFTANEATAFTIRSITIAVLVLRALNALPDEADRIVPLGAISIHLTRDAHLAHQVANGERALALVVAPALDHAAFRHAITDESHRAQETIVTRGAVLGAAQTAFRK